MAHPSFFGNDDEESSPEFPRSEATFAFRAADFETDLNMADQRPAAVSRHDTRTTLLPLERADIYCEW